MLFLKQSKIFGLALLIGAFAFLATFELKCPKRGADGVQWAPREPSVAFGGAAVLGYGSDYGDESDDDYEEEDDWGPPVAPSRWGSGSAFSVGAPPPPQGRYGGSRRPAAPVPGSALARWGSPSPVASPWSPAPSALGKRARGSFGAASNVSTSSGVPRAGPPKKMAQTVSAPKGFVDPAKALSRLPTKTPGFFGRGKAAKAAVAAGAAVRGKDALAPGEHYYRVDGKYVSPGDAQQLVDDAFTVDRIVDDLDEKLFKDLHDVQDQLVRRLSTTMIDEQETLAKLGLKLNKIMSDQDWKEIEGEFEEDVHVVMEQAAALIEKFQVAYDELIDFTEEKALEMAEALSDFYETLRKVDTKVGPYMSQNFARQIGTTLSKWFMNLRRKAS